jgi:hypothetical protein
MKKANRISIWAFGAAPDDLRKLHTGDTVPEWVALVPKGVHGAHIDEAIRGQGSLVFRHETAEGDSVYMGLNLTSIDQRMFQPLPVRTSQTATM